MDEQLNAAVESIFARIRRKVGIPCRLCGAAVDRMSGGAPAISRVWGIAQSGATRQ